MNKRYIHPSLISLLVHNKSFNMHDMNNVYLRLPICSLKRIKHAIYAQRSFTVTF